MKAAEENQSGVGSLLMRVTFGKHPKRTAVRIVVLVTVCWVVFKYVLLPIKVVGISMAPSYRHGRLNFVNRLAYRTAKPQRGDVVAIRLAGASAALMKRIVGLPGETIAIDQGVVLINGQPLSEPYVKGERALWQEPEKKLAEDEYFVIGDNREMQQGQHDYGRANVSRILGKVLF